jgi:NAD(P)-dependent dehydrogenase (short-subunit alcohol dehydrogenase family)
MSTINKLMDLSGRYALITGATGNLGSVMADTLGELGANLILVDRSLIELDDLATSLVKKWGNKVACYVCDLESEGDRIELIKNVTLNHKSLNILVNNAAFIGASDLEGWSVPFEKQTITTWRRAMEVNLTAVFHLCQAFAPILRGRAGASIVNIASIYGMYGPDWKLYEGTQMNNPAAYGASKGGLLQLTRWLSTALATEIRVNALSPGGISRNQPNIFVERYEDRTPLGRMAREDDFRGAIAFLATDMSAYCTGQNLEVSGGWGVW